MDKCGLYCAYVVSVFDVCDETFVVKAMTGL